MPINRYYLADFLSIQRQSFFTLLETGLMEEFKKRNPITNTKKDLSLYFYPEYYILTRPEYSPQEAILKNKSYTSKLFVPVQFTDKKQKLVSFKWVYIGNLPMMTKRGHFILNGAARVIVNQIIRSPGVYYQQKLYENFEEKWSQKPDDSFKRYYADLICMRGTWLRIEMDKEKNIWAQMKKGPKIPMYWFLLAMGLSEKRIFKSVLDSEKLIGNLEKIDPGKETLSKDTLDTLNNEEKSLEMRDNDLTDLKAPKKKKHKYHYLKNPPEAWAEIYSLMFAPTVPLGLKATGKVPFPPPLGTPPPSRVAGADVTESGFSIKNATGKKTLSKGTELLDPGVLKSLTNEENKDEVLTDMGTSPESEVNSLINGENPAAQSHDTNSNSKKNSQVDKNSLKFLKGAVQKTQSENGRKWLYNRFMNPRSYDLGKQGRLAFNKKFGLTISPNQMTLTGLDVLYATDYLVKVDKGLYKIDDIDHLKNRRVRTSGELIGIQIGVGLVRLEKYVRDTFNKTSVYNSMGLKAPGSKAVKRILTPTLSPEVGGITGQSPIDSPLNQSLYEGKQDSSLSVSGNKITLGLSALGRSGNSGQTYSISIPPSVGNPEFSVKNYINHKAFNSSIREFFGTSPLSQFMDQINPLAELTHKRRLSSMGPGGVTRDTATLAIRGIHPTHYGRICPIETPEGKNTGLVNSMTTYARVNPNGIIESPFYKVYKGQVQRNTGIYYFSAEQEEKIKLAAADLSISRIDFLPSSNIPVRISEDFTKIPRSQVQYIGVSPLQMISIAASLIPFLEHDDANRALMGSNMQRQAVPLIRPERAIVGTGLEARAVSDSGHVLISKYSGVVTHVSAKKIVVYSLVNS